MNVRNGPESSPKHGLVVVRRGWSTILERTAWSGLRYSWLLILVLALLVALHLPYLKLPYFWDEMGQFAPAALDIYNSGSWVPHSTQPNVHPPGVMALVALIWRIFGYSILASRLTMLGVASLGVLCSFLLAIRLARGTPGRRRMRRFCS